MQILIHKSGNLKTGAFSVLNRSALSGCVAALCAYLFLGLLARAAQSLQWEERPGYRVAELSPVGSATDHGFDSIPSNHSGVTFTNDLSLPRLSTNVNLMNGSGVGLGDFDNDGLCDIYLCNLEGPNKLYRNLGGFRFKDVTESAGVACGNMLSTGAVFADLNGDGWSELIVTSMGGPNAFFVNQGNGRFANETEKAGLSSRFGSSSIAVSDTDGDGDLDLYIANFGATSILRTGGRVAVGVRNGKQVVRGRYAKRIKIIDGVMYEFGEPDYFYLNRGDGTFEKQSWTGGLFRDQDGNPFKEAPLDQGLSVMMRDMNQDGHPDIYVCNDAFTPDRFYLNDGTGKFQEISSMALRQTCYFSMGVDFADYDRDGLDDFFVVDMLSRKHEYVMTQQSSIVRSPRRIGSHTKRDQIRRNTFYKARGDGTYVEMANYLGLAATEWTWSVAFMDVDLDGWEDVLVTNGFPFNVDDQDTREAIAAMGRLSVSQSRRTISKYPPLNTPNVAMKNPGNGPFQDMGDAWGFNDKRVSNGMALADLDNDGDQDVVINAFNSEALVYRNKTAAGRVAVRLRGAGGNTQGIGARVRFLGGPVAQEQEIVGGGRYVGGDDPIRVFAADPKRDPGSIQVTWRSGKVSRIPDVRANRYYEISESSAEDAVGELASEPAKESWFAEDSQSLSHQHHELAVPSMETQPLLWKSLSRYGPSAAWFDTDGDQRDELVVGAARGGKPVVFRWENDRFVESEIPLKPATSDYSMVLGVSVQSGKYLLLARSGYESKSEHHLTVLRCHPDGRFELVQEGIQEGVGALAVADVDLDGQLDLFLGGRPIMRRYPESTPSRLIYNLDDWIQGDDTRVTNLENAGLVHGAVFSDLDQDGTPELILACEWGPVRVYGFKSQVPKELTEQWNLGEVRGWWHGVSTGDFNRDGLPDIVASNWGLNDRYSDYLETQDLQLSYGEFGSTGSVGLIESYFDSETGSRVPVRDRIWIKELFPNIASRFPTHVEYGRADLESILKGQEQNTRVKGVNTLSAALFQNQGGAFQRKEMPLEAQLAPSFAPVISDFNGDGFEDVFLSQNFFALHNKIPRQDAGRGQLLQGSESGLAAVSGAESGIKVYGEQRSAAVADYNQDGRVDLLLTQNGGRTLLFMNQRSQPGVRVRFIGSENNPDAIGTSYRVVYEGELGPLREIQAGMGYWSQNSHIQTITMENKSSLMLDILCPDGLRIRRRIEATRDKIVQIPLYD